LAVTKIFSSTFVVDLLEKAWKRAAGKVIQKHKIKITQEQLIPDNKHADVTTKRKFIFYFKR
jgi:hypothetical protein